MQILTGVQIFMRFLEPETCTLFFGLYTFVKRLKTKIINGLFLAKILNSGRNFSSYRNLFSKWSFKFYLFKKNKKLEKNHVSKNCKHLDADCSHHWWILYPAQELKFWLSVKCFVYKYIILFSWKTEVVKIVNEEKFWRTRYDFALFAGLKNIGFPT